MTAEITCHLCNRPTRNTVRYFCPTMEFHILCVSCEPLLVVFPNDHPESKTKRDRAIFCPTNADEAQRVLAALRDPEKIPVDPFGEATKMMTKLLARCFSAGTTNVETLRAAIEASGVNLDQSAVAAQKLSLALTAIKKVVGGQGLS